MINPKNVTALGWLGSIEALQKNFFMAEKYLHEALKIEKNNLSFVLNYANILFEIKKFHEAEKYYTKIPQIIGISISYRKYIVKKNRKIEWKWRYIL